MLLFGRCFVRMAPEPAGGAAMQRVRVPVAAAILVGVGVLVACRTDAPVRPAERTTEPRMQSFVGSEWSAPTRLDAPVNSPSANDQGPALSSDGLALYFCSSRMPGSGGNDLWVARRASSDDAWGDPANLGPAVNSDGGDCGPSMSVDGRLLFFTSNRAGSQGNDIYMSTRTDASDDFSWSTPARLGAEINTAASEFSPFITRWYDDEEDDSGGRAAEL